MRARRLFGHALLFVCVVLAAIVGARFAMAAPRDAGLDGGLSDGATDGESDASEVAVDAELEAAPAVVESAQVPPPIVSASAQPNDAPRAIAEGSPVRLHDKRIFAIRVAHSGIAAEERARRASSALERAFDESESDDVHVDESKPNLAVIIVGNRPIVELTQEDADASGDVSLGAHAAGTAENVRSAIKTERTRRDVSQRVFAWSLVVLSALIAFLLLRRTRDIAERVRTWVKDNPQRLPALRIGSVEVMRPAAFQGVIRIGISLLERAIQLTLLYVWLVFMLSRFESTKDLGGKITTTILTPLGALVGRIAISVPLIVVAIVAVIVVFIIVRFIRLFFRSVEVGETQLAWLPPDLASVTSAVVRLAVVVGAVVIGAPLVTGTEQGSASRASFVVLGALGVALVPLFAAMVIGFSTVFWRRLRVGDFVSFDGRQGRVASLNLLEVRVHDGEVFELRIPHLLMLVRLLRVIGPYPLATFEVVVDPAAHQGDVRKLLTTAGTSKHGAPRVRLLSIDVDGARYEVVAKRDLDVQDPATAITRALIDAGISLGKNRGA